MKNNKAFTLIELLVVVLIIAILAAIALPKYKLTVERAHASEAYTMIKSIAEAGERYALATGGTYPAYGEWEVLDIEIPGSVSGNFIIGENWTWWLSYQDERVLANRNPNGTKYYLQYFYLYHPNSGSFAGRYKCAVYSGSNFSFYQKVCGSLCGTSLSGSTNFCFTN